MKFLVAIMLMIALCIVIQDVNAWGRRRRRGKSGWFKKTVKKVGGWYNKHKPTIHKVGGAVWNVVKKWKKDSDKELVDLAYLKEHDRDEYDGALQQIRLDVEEEFPETDASQVVATLDELISMDPDERSRVMHSLDVEGSHQYDLEFLEALSEPTADMD
nr:botryllin [Botryllus schlosseri]